MDFSYVPFYYPTFPVQYEQMQDQGSADFLPTRFQTGYYVPQPTYLPPIQPMMTTKPTPDNKSFSYDKNELRSSIFNQILETFPNLSNAMDTNQPKVDPPTCMYQKPTSTRYSDCQPFENNLANDIMREEFDSSTSCASPAIQSFPAPVTKPPSRDPITDLLEQALSSAAARVTKPKKKQDPIVCSVCQKTFSSKANLKIHFQQHEGNKRPHQCQHCGKRFTQKSTLRTHIRVHTGERPYKCEHCPKSFADFSTYTKHVRIHSGERPYVCQVCGKGFAQSGNMIRHREIHN